MYLIVGATGSLGGRVARALLERGEPVRALVRAESPLRRAGRFTDPEELTSLGAELVSGDLTRPESLEPHLSGVKSVLMTASGTKRMPPDTLEAVDHQGAAALAKAAKAAGVEHFVYVSAKGTGPHAPEFLRPKWLGESAIRESGMPATFVRPGQYMQDWIGFVLGAQLQGGAKKVQLIGQDDPMKTFVDEDDVASLLTTLLLEGPPTGGDTVRLVEIATDSASHGEIVDRMATLTGMPLSVERLDVGQSVTTVPDPVAATLTQLLTITAGVPADSHVTPEVSERYGLEPRSIDDFLTQMLGRGTS